MTDLSATETALLRRLLDESACRAVLERYTYAVDWMNWAGLSALCWPDAHFDFGLWQGDTAAFLPWVQALEEGYARRLHLFAAPRIEVGGDAARAEAGALLYLRSKPAADGTHDDLMLGRYQFSLARRGGEWRLSGLQFLLHGAQRFPASDQGGAPFFADGLDPGHRWFAQ